MAPASQLSDRRQSGYAGSWDRKLSNFAVALNWGTGSSSLNALVNAFDRLHIVRGKKFSYCAWATGSLLVRLLTGVTLLQLGQDRLKARVTAKRLQFFVSFESLSVGETRVNQFT